ncbi:hypothetical protein PRZ48_007351 [Zasmidium cellare]|uniref:Uncharacterized protein n=1 Tax=Zasmidium cellare TaxID=395010 RepID=A0ABR0EJ37_ZASCE|nr:hypothetical protein PRZ48_007351 [Zasmidium cellare]
MAGTKNSWCNGGDGNIVGGCAAGENHYCCIDESQAGAVIVEEMVVTLGFGTVITDIITVVDVEEPALVVTVLTVVLVVQAGGVWMQEQAVEITLAAADW